jgi:hypothetical protein
MRNMLFWPAAVLLSCVLLGAPAWAADEDVYGEHLLPPETLMFFSVPSVPDLIDQGGESALGQLLVEPKMQPFLDSLKDTLREAGKRVEDELGVTLDDLLDLPQGEFTIALVERPARKLALVLLIDCGDNQATLDKLLERMDGALDKEGAEHSTQTAGDVEIHVYKVPTEDNNPFNTLAYFTEEGYVVFGTEVAALKAVIERWDGKNDDTLAKAGVFSYILEQCSSGEDEPVIKWYLNPIGLVQAGVSMVQGQNPQAGLVLGMLPIFGLDRLKGLGGGLDFVVDDFDTVSKMFFYVEQPASGVLGTLRFPATEQKPPQWVPASAATYMGLNWDAKGAYESVETIFDSFQGPGALAKVLDDLDRNDNGPGLHFKRDLLDLLTGRVDVVTQPPKLDGNGDAPPLTGMVIALGVQDSGKMQRTLDKASKSDGFPGKIRQVEGQTVYDLPVKDEDAALSVTVAADALFFSTLPDVLNNVLRGGSRDALASSPDYADIAKHFPKRTSIISYQRQDTQVEAVWEQLKKLDTHAVEGLDLSKLPDFEVVRKYLRSSGSYAIPDKKGALFVGFSLAD